MDYFSHSWALIFSLAEPALPNCKALRCNKSVNALQFVCSAFVLALLLPLSLVSAPSGELEKLRNAQDRGGLDSRASALHADAEKAGSDANKWYRSAVAFSYAAEVAYELRDKKGSQHAAEAGLSDAERAISINGCPSPEMRKLQLLGRRSTRWRKP